MTGRVRSFRRSPRPGTFLPSPTRPHAGITITEEPTDTTTVYSVRVRGPGPLARPLRLGLQQGPWAWRVSLLVSLVITLHYITFSAKSCDSPVLMCTSTSSPTNSLRAPLKDMCAYLCAAGGTYARDFARLRGSCATQQGVSRVRQSTL